MSKKTFVREIIPYVELHRDMRTGIAWIENGRTGNGHSCHANIDATGSIRGMKKRGYWGRDDRCVKSHGYIYNIDTFVVTDAWDEVAAAECRCAACIERRSGV
jgi:hypothetical protein